jgi:uncharacterized protein YaeQ
MAEKAIIYKVDLHVSDMDRQYFNDHALTLAKHPSENEQRLMIRLLAFALYAEEGLAFGKGVSTKEEPTLWLKDLRGDIQTWIEIGQPDLKYIRKACGRSSNVVIFLYGNSTDIWWEKNKADCQKKNNLKVIQLSTEVTKSLSLIANRNMDITCTIDDTQVSIFCADESFSFTPTVLYP